MKALKIDFIGFKFIISYSVNAPLDVKRGTGCYLHSIANMFCAVCIPISGNASLQTTQITESGGLFPIEYLAWLFDHTVITKTRINLYVSDRSYNWSIIQSCIENKIYALYTQQVLLNML